MHGIKLTSTAHTHTQNEIFFEIVKNYGNIAVKVHTISTIFFWLLKRNLGFEIIQKDGNNYKNDSNKRMYKLISAYNSITSSTCHVTKQVNYE